MFPQWGQTFHHIDPNQQLYWQQYYGYQSQPINARMWSGAVPASSAVGHTMGQASHGVQSNTPNAAILPPEPPKDEAPPPPLPADPPPPPAPEETPQPKDSQEQQKLTELQQQAAQWQQQKQWQEYQQNLIQYQQQLQQWNAQQASILDQINQEEKEFEIQYSEWMKQYNEWKEQNKHHPNHDQYMQYEQQWKQYEEQMALKRDYIKQQKAQAMLNQQMAQAPSSLASSFGTVDQGMSSLATSSTETKSELISSTPASSLASSAFGGGTNHGSSGGHPTSSCPPVSGYHYPNYTTGRFGGEQNQRFPMPTMGTTPWQQQQRNPEPNANASLPTQSFGPGVSQGANTSEYGMKQTATDFGIYTSSQYGTSQQSMSEFGAARPRFGFGSQMPEARMRLPPPHGPMDQTSRNSSLGVNSSEGGQNFTQSSNYSDQHRDESFQAHHFQQPDGQTRFPGPRPFGRMHQDRGVPNAFAPGISNSDSAFGVHGQGSNASQNVPFSGSWGSGNSVRPYETSGTSSEQPSQFSGSGGGMHSAEYSDSTDTSHQAQQSHKFLGSGNSEPSKLLDLNLSMMSGSRFPSPYNASEAGNDSSQLSNHFGPRSSSIQSPDSRFMRPSLPNRPHPFDLEHGRYDDDNLGTQQMQSPGPRFPGPRGPGTGPDFHPGEPRFPVMPGMRPHNEQEPAYGTPGYPGPRGPGFSPEFQHEPNFSDTRFPGPHGLRARPDFPQEFGSGRFTGPRIFGPGSDNQRQQMMQGGTRFNGPRGPRMGADVGFGESRFPGPRAPNLRPEMDVGGTFPRPRGPDFQQEPRFSGPRASLGARSDNQQPPGNNFFDPNISSRMEFTSRFPAQGPRGPGLGMNPNSQQGMANTDKQFLSTSPSNTGAIKPPVLDSAGRGLSKQAEMHMSSPSQQLTTVRPLLSNLSQKPETKNEGLNKPDTGLNKEMPQNQTESPNTLLSGAAVPSSSGAKTNFESPGISNRPSGVSGPTKTQQLDVQSIGTKSTGLNEAVTTVPQNMQSPGPGVKPRVFGVTDVQTRVPVSENNEYKFTKWQAPTGMELEEDFTEMEQAEPLVEGHPPFGFGPRGRIGMGSGPRFPAPGLMLGNPRGIRPPFPRTSEPHFRPQVGDVNSSMDPFAPPEEEDFTEYTEDAGVEVQEDFSRDYGEEGFFGKRKASDFGPEEVFEEEGMPPNSKFGRMDPNLRAPFPRMPSGRGFSPRGMQFDAGTGRFGGPGVMRPRFEATAGKMLRPQGPVPLMQLSVRRVASSMFDAPGSELEMKYQEGEVPEEHDEAEEHSEAKEYDSEFGMALQFRPQGPSDVRDDMMPRMPFGPRGNMMRWPRPPRMEHLAPGMGRGGLGTVRGPFHSPRGGAFGQPRFGFPGDDQNEDYPEESYSGLQPPDAEYNEEENPLGTEQNWNREDCEEDGEPPVGYAVDESTGRVDGDGAPIFSEREHELIKKAAEELKLLRQKQDQIDVLTSMAPVLEKPKPPVTTLVPYPNDDAQEESEEIHRYEDERKYLDRDDRFIDNERPPRQLRGRFVNDVPHPEEEFGADPFRDPRHGDHLPRRLPLHEFDFRGPPRDFEPGFRERPWREDPDFHKERLARDRDDHRPYDNQRGPPLDWDRRTAQPNERGPRNLPLPNPREFLDSLENRSRIPPFGRRPPQFEDVSHPGSSAVFEYGHGDHGNKLRQPDAEPEEFWQDRDDDMRFRGGWERDRDFRQERDAMSSDYDRNRRPPFPDIHERPGRPEPRDRDFSSSFDRERGPRERDFDNRGSVERLSREPPTWNREQHFDHERNLLDRDHRDHDRRPFDRDHCRDRGVAPEDPFSRVPPQGPMAPTFVDEVKIEVAAVDDLLMLPVRRSRPDHIVVIIRGLPGAGKTFVSKLLKDKEVANGGTAPRMLCLDDYFMVETEKMVEDPETGKKAKKTVMEYEYDPGLEPSYKVSFLKSFKRQIDDCYFNFIIVDAIFDKVEYLEEFWSYAKSKGFQVYVVEMQAEVSVCAKRNTHQRKQADIQKIIDGWEETPRHYIRLDVRSLLQDAAIEDVEMEDTTNDVAVKSAEEKAEDETEEEAGLQGLKKSKWEMDTSEQQLDKLDGIRVGMKKHEVVPQRLEDYLQLPDDYDSRKSEPGKKRVRWADIEERKDQLRRRELGFVIGQTDWAKMTDDSYADRALNRTKYF